jgi:acyloxyacyl hydrolase
MGGKAWQLIEPIDGFHINQIAHTLASDIYWDILTTQRPEWLGPINPNNEEIAKIFGDQGGY